jgi:peptidoglycan/LPS O-acetylase OafA/YrhL
VTGALVAVEGVIGVLIAVVMVVRGIGGHEERAISGYGTAAWFLLLGGPVLAAGVALILGHRWGRTIAIVAQLLLLPVAWSLLSDSDQPAWGIAVGLFAIAGLILSFAPSAVRWGQRN